MISCGTPCPFSNATPKPKLTCAAAALFINKFNFSCALISPWLAASRYHLSASSKFCRTPCPLSNIIPKLICASAIPLFAKSVNNWSAVVNSFLPNEFIAVSKRSTSNLFSRKESLPAFNLEGLSIILVSCSCFAFALP